MTFLEIGYVLEERRFRALVNLSLPRSILFLPSPPPSSFIPCFLRFSRGQSRNERPKTCPLSRAEKSSSTGHGLGSRRAVCGHERGGPPSWGPGPLKERESEGAASHRAPGRRESRREEVSISREIRRERIPVVCTHVQGGPIDLNT